MGLQIHHALDLQLCVTTLPKSTSFEDLPVPPGWVQRGSRLLVMFTFL